MSDDLKTPERIWACLSVNSKNGTVVLLGHAHFNLSGWQEYVRADRIEDLERERDESEAAAKIWQEDFIQENNRWCDASRKLDKAMEALVQLQLIIGDILGAHMQDSESRGEALALIKNTLAELEGGK
jgi:hypothetical protein